MVYRIQTEWRRTAILALACAVMCCGCQSGMYKAARLPNEFRCSPIRNADVISFGGASRPGAASTVIGTDDLLEVTVSTGRDGEKPTPLKARVDGDGSIALPSIGSVSVAGLKPFEAGKNIEQASIERGIYRKPQVALEIKEKAVNRVTVLGKVNEPGVKELPRGASDLLSALALAGGPTEEAGTEVEIRRRGGGNVATNADGSDVQLASYQGEAGPPRSNVQHIDLADPGQTEVADLRLNDGDVIHVFPQPERMVYVGGLVKNPGQFEIPRNQDLYLAQAIQMAGDKSSPVADKIVVTRRMPDRAEPIVIEASIGRAKHDGRENIRLAAGDVVSVEQTPSTVVVDTLLNFVRFSVGVAGRTALF